MNLDHDQSQKAAPLGMAKPYSPNDAMCVP